MTKALFWKEWRTQRPLVFAGLGLAAIMPLFLMAGLMASSYNWRVEDLMGMTIPIFAMLIWPLFTLAIAGTAFAADMTDDSLRFLLSRPVSRARVWFVKIGAALAALLVVIIGTSLIGFFYALLVAEDRGELVSSVVREFRGEPVWEVLLGTVIASSPFLFLFGCAAFCSMFAKRPMAAAIGGVLVATGLTFGVALVWMLAMPRFNNLALIFYNSGMFYGSPVAAVCIWIAGLWVFWRGDIFAGDARRQALRPLLAVVAVVALLGSGPAVYTSARYVARLAANRVGDLALIDGAITIVEPTPSGFSTRVVRVPADGSPPVVVAPNATSPAASPDGNWVVYVAHGGYLGMRSGEMELRAVRTDGTDDHAISGSVAWPDEFWMPFTVLVAPDSDQVAYVGAEEVVVTTISEGRATLLEADLARDIRTRARDGGVLGWTEGEPAELLYYRTTNRYSYPSDGSSEATRPGPAMQMTELLAYDQASGESRLLREFPGHESLRVWGLWLSDQGSMRAWRWLPTWVPSAEGVEMVAVDTTTGELVELSSSPCVGWGFSGEGRRIVYGNCGGDIRDGDSWIEIRTRDLETGADELFAFLENYDDSSYARELLISPGGEHLLLYAREGRSRWATHLVSRGGEVRVLREGWLPVAWVSDHEVLLTPFRGYGPLYLSVLNADTGVIREIHP